MRVRNAGRAAALSAALTVLIGCAGDNMADVSGTVTVDGAPAEKGSVTFVPADGKSPTAGCEIAIPVTEFQPGARFAFVRDPEGNRIELLDVAGL